MRRLGVVFMLIALVTCGATALAAGKYGKRIGKKSHSGAFATATASGSAQKPARVYVKVTTKPRQNFRLFWSTACSRTASSKSKSKSGNFSGTGSKIKRIGFKVKKPLFCGVGASGSLQDGSGRITIQIYSKQRK